MSWFVLHRSASLATLHQILHTVRMQVLLFHHSDKPRDWSNDHQANRQCYYWFSDRFHELSGILVPSPYVYFFLVALKDVGARHQVCPRTLKNFDELYSAFLDSQSRFTDIPRNGMWFPEPPFLASFEKIMPVLGARLTDNGKYDILFPDAYSGKRFRMYDEVLRRFRFVDIPTLVEAIPQIKEALPFVSPYR